MISTEYSTCNHNKNTVYNQELNRINILAPSLLFYLLAPMFSTQYLVRRRLRQFWTFPGCFLCCYPPAAAVAAAVARTCAQPHLPCSPNLAQTRDVHRELH